MNSDEKNNSSVAMTLNKVSWRNNDYQVLNNIDLSIRYGEITTLFGPNGAGKTSLLRLMAGDFFSLSDNQDVVLADNLQAIYSSSKKRAQHIVVLPQSSSLQFAFTVKEVVSMGRMPYTNSSETNHHVVVEAMERMDIVDLADVYYPQLSGGEKQRVHLARIYAQIMQSAKSDVKENMNKLLLLDEPTAALDLQFQSSFLEMIRFLADCGVAVVMVSHDLNLSLKCSDHFIAMKAGEVMEQGSNEIITASLIENLFSVKASILEHPHGQKWVAF